ncbi:hypothetical protein H8S10_12910 [Clostridium sp. NSJ-49]|uniref:Hydroxyethylthiazole kinase n=1 Tax=Clostridium disporicum TaxID=84024 RepID=A0A174CJU8_9CLOT|nr:MULTISPECIES: hypothetical protein [Clostridium]MBC5626357.1 hypothetical protein [Clostridium sp. NSJ-49]MCD2501341.1 hypothetical protein [Clostridium sp. NSJ-145]CUO12078.1 hydroxyethylthiazole kinase [Clostridium disporicum]
MKLSSETITNAFNLRMFKELVIQCIVSKDRINDIRETIESYNNNIKLIYEITENDEVNIDGLLINLEHLESENLIEIEEYLISSKKSKEIILDLCGINKSRDNRDLILSFINRYDIDIVKGTKEEVISLIDGQKYYLSSQDDKYRDFSRKNNTILIIKDTNYWITDGYSEFTVSIEENLLDDKEFEDILTGLILACTALYDRKEQRVEAILLAINIFEISKKVALKRVEIDGFKNLIKEYLIREIASLNSEEIYKISEIGYRFKR